MHEWRLAPAAWLQLGAGEPAPRGTGAILRFGVGDIETARAHLQAAGARLGDVTTIPGVVAFCDAVAPVADELSLDEDLSSG